MLDLVRQENIRAKIGLVVYKDVVREKKKQLISLCILLSQAETMNSFSITIYC